MIGTHEMNDLGYFKEPVLVKVKVSDYRLSEFFGEVAFMVRSVDGRDVSGVAPSHVFIEEEKSVLGMAMGRENGGVLIFFAPTQHEGTALTLSEHILTQ